MPSSQDSINKNGVFLKAKSKEENTRLPGLARAFHLGLESYEARPGEDLDRKLDLEEKAVLDQGWIIRKQKA